MNPNWQNESSCKQYIDEKTRYSYYILQFPKSLSLTCVVPISTSHPLYDKFKKRWLNAAFVEQKFNFKVDIWTAFSNLGWIVKDNYYETDKSKWAVGFHCDLIDDLVDFNAKDNYCDADFIHSECKKLAKFLWKCENE
jgi:hypothetical protein